MHNNVFLLILYASSIIPSALLALLAVELCAVSGEQSRTDLWSLPCIAMAQLEPNMHRNKTIFPLYALICIIATEFNLQFYCPVIQDCRILLYVLAVSFGFVRTKQSCVTSLVVFLASLFVSFSSFMITSSTTDPNRVLAGITQAQ